METRERQNSPPFRRLEAGTRPDGRSELPAVDGAVTARPFLGDPDQEYWAGRIPANLLLEAERYATRALVLGIASFFWMPILAPLAIYQGNSACNILDQYPRFRATPARDKARTGQICGWVALSLFGFKLIRTFLFGIGAWRPAPSPGDWPAATAASLGQLMNHAGYCLLVLRDSRRSAIAAQ